MNNLFISQTIIIPEEQCYACKHDLIGEIKKYRNNHHDEELWECWCQEEYSTEIIKFYCPICNEFFKESNYLRSVIKDQKVLWVANMITHYRHNHIKWWDKKWGHNSPYSKTYGNYDEDKFKVNNTSKRQIIRKCHTFLNDYQINREHFLKLLENDGKTINLINKILLF